MKRLWIAVGLLAVAVGLCVTATLYQHRQIDRMLGTLDRLETAYTAGDSAEAHRLAEQLATDYEATGQVLYCFIAHKELADSQETVAVLPALLRQGGEEELRMEIARLREQFRYLRDVDDPTVWNIL